MRVRVHVYTAAASIPWPELHRPGRSLVYSLLRQQAAGLAEQLHGDGWRRGMVPFGFCPPVFPEAARTSGVYAAGGAGWLEIGTPVTEVARAVAEGLEGRVGGYIDWGGVALRVNSAEVVDPPAELASGQVVWRTSTPVCVKAHDNRQGETRWLMPEDGGWLGRVGANARRKAETLGLRTRVTVQQVLWSGNPRMHVVASGGDGAKRGALAEVKVVGDPDALRALWCWGLGEANTAGMGWIGAQPVARDRPVELAHAGSFPGSQARRPGNPGGSPSGRGPGVASRQRLRSRRTP